MKKTRTLSKIFATLLIGTGLSLGAISVHADGNHDGGNNNGGNHDGGNHDGGHHNGPSPTPKNSPTPGKPSPTPKPPKPTPTPKPGQCVVCDHVAGKNQDHRLDCKDVDSYLRDHPTSTRGPCNATPVTNP